MSVKNSIDAMESQTFLLVAQCLNQLHHRVPQMGVVACLNPGIEPLDLAKGLDGHQNVLDAFEKRKYSPTYLQWDLLLDLVAAGTGATGCISQTKERVEKFLMTEH
jgi:hypothetical protein